MNNQNEKPLISIVVPVYNVEEYLEESINSLLNQTYTNTEIILVDDKSTDKSGTICDSYLENKKVKVIHKDINEGLGKARNTGIENANGKYIAFVDSDDYIDTNYFELLYQSLIDSLADVAYCGHIKFSVNGERVFSNMLAGHTCSEEEIIKVVIPRMCGRTKENDQLQMSSCMALYSLEIIKKFDIRFPSEREYISEDLIFNILYLLKCNRACFTPGVGYHYRYNEKSLTHVYLEDRFEKQKIMTQKIETLTQSIGNYAYCKEQIANTFLIWVRACIQMEQRRYNTTGYINSLKRIRDICSDKFVQKVLDTRHAGNDKLSSEIINCLIKLRLCKTLWALMAVKNRKIIMENGLNVTK